MRAIPSGSVLSMKSTFIGSATRVPEGVGHKHRAEGRTANADGQYMGEFEARGGPDGAVMYSVRKLLDLSQGAADFGGNCR